MMTILKLRPELINARMGELFEALHNWELSNWLSEPFRTALVQQLQIFIKENCRHINLLPANDSSSDNKTITKMILAIAVQCFLAKDSDKVDLPINRAMFYRYVSYLYPGNLISLLDKGADSILGVERPLEFVWNDTEHPTLLMLKATHPASVAEERNLLVKTYTTSKASIHLTQGNIQVIAQGADPDSTVLPNNVIDWLSPRISLIDDIKISNHRKSKDLNTFRQMWEDIEWSILGLEQSPGEKIEKTKPFDGEEVRVIIDEMRIVKDLPKSRQLQFHCTIVDDLFMGDGWMPCDKFHMIRWLTSNDVPSNYDGSLSFARDSNGNPLLFTANASTRGEIIEFSIKSQIEDYLLESMYPGEESVCIVTYLDRINNAWLCLSEKGCTFKVPCDEVEEGLSEGMLVRVRYIEPDRSGQSIEFFMGELSENQDNLPLSIKKSQCLYNLMQGMGEISGFGADRNSKVVEVEEVMSHDELMELIYMFQRCAYSEKEYIKAFNYLGLASLLSKLAEAPDLIKEISTHMELLQLLQDFGRNHTVDPVMLSSCENKVKNTPMLERLHTRLKIVADLDLNENSEWLWNLRKNPRNEIESHLASLVLSYNMLPTELEKPRKDIIKEISTLLNVNSSAPSSKYYGDESQTVEFKSSLIYSTHGGAKPDAKEQLFEIVHIICGFMNARGGNLFIGVNDSGYENGLEDDLAYRRTHGMKPTIDAMMVDLQNHLDRVMPMHARDHWEIESDSESKKGVIVVKVLPVSQPVEHDGIIYVRSSSTTKPRLGDQRDEFINNRAHNYQLLMKIWGVGKDEDTTEDIPLSEEQATPVVIQSKQLENDETKTRNDETQDTLPENFQGATEAPIITGRHRLNVLHSYDANFVTPAYYLYFHKDGYLRFKYDDAYFDYLQEWSASLAVRDKEKNGVLVMAYADGAVSRIPMWIFSSYSDNEDCRFRNDSILEFINIATINDYLLSVVETAFGAIYYRIDAISNIKESSSLDDPGTTLCDNKYKILAQEIVAPDKLAFFNPEALNRERRFWGVQVPQGDGTLSIQEKIQKLLNPVAHSE
ncbi:MAG: ATP-binding protein [Muribaculaceae bacterium]